MKNLIAVMFTVGCLLVMPNYSSAQLNAAPKTQLSHSELKKLEREAKTPAEIRQLVDYYRQREQELNAKAADQKTEWERRSQNVTGPSAKARSVDSARNLYEYYQYQADQAGKLAALYEKRAEGHASPDGAAV